MNRGGPLKRKTKLRTKSAIKRGTSRLSRETPIKKLGRRGKEALAALAKSRPIVLARAAGQCEWCGARAELDVHHVLGRGRNPGHALLHEPESLVAICRRCHDAEHFGG